MDDIESADGIEERFRALMPVTNKWAYFDNAAVAPLPSQARDAIAHWLKQATEEGDTVWPSWAAGIEKTRQTAASILGADSSEIALIPNTTTGLSLVAEGFPWQLGDNVITLANPITSVRNLLTSLLLRPLKFVRLNL